jgi:formate hydrogenlyase subunit 6/NADH:ubiquinone oxidoreductase subunit I
MVAEQRLYQVSAGWLKSAVDALRGAGVEVLAPTKAESGAVDLAPITDAGQICLDYGNITTPLKRVFFPITEVLLRYDNRGDGDVDVRAEPVAPTDERAVLGCRPCDAAALDAMDKVFQWDYDDVRYRARRERTTLVSFACTEPAAECFCTSVGLSPHEGRQSDVLVFLYGSGGSLLQVFTDKGRKFVERLGEVAKPAPPGTECPVQPDIETKFDPEKVKSWLDDNFESDFWAERSLGCLGCGACSYLCPTCHCFDIVDESTWNHGERRRNWDCCATSLFTLHASGHNPRPAIGARYRQRIMHKFKYFPERFGPIACVGCGRCVKTCGAGRNVTDALGEIESRQEARAEK